MYGLHMVTPLTQLITPLVTTQHQHQSISPWLVGLHVSIYGIYIHGLAFSSYALPFYTHYFHFFHHLPVSIMDQAAAMATIARVAFNQPMNRPTQPQADSPGQSFRAAVTRASEVKLPSGHDKQDWLRRPACHYCFVLSYIWYTRVLISCHIDTYVACDIHVQPLQHCGSPVYEKVGTHLCIPCQMCSSIYIYIYTYAPAGE